MEKHLSSDKIARKDSSRRAILSYNIIVLEICQ